MKRACRPSFLMLTPDKLHKTERNVFGCTLYPILLQANYLMS
jgi:hypothetical protein